MRLVLFVITVIFLFNLNSISGSSLRVVQFNSEEFIKINKSLYVIKEFDLKGKLIISKAKIIDDKLSVQKNADDNIPGIKTSNLLLNLKVSSSVDNSNSMETINLESFFRKYVDKELKDIVLYSEDDDFVMLAVDYSNKSLILFGSLYRYIMLEEFFSPFIGEVPRRKEYFIEHWTNKAEFYSKYTKDFFYLLNKKYEVITLEFENHLFVLCNFELESKNQTISNILTKEEFEKARAELKNRKSGEIYIKNIGVLRVLANYKLRFLSFNKVK